MGHGTWDMGHGTGEERSSSFFLRSLRGKWNAPHYLNYTYKYTRRRKRDCTTNLSKRLTLDSFLPLTIHNTTCHKNISGTIATLSRYFNYSMNPNAAKPNLDDGPDLPDIDTLLESLQSTLFQEMMGMIGDATGRDYT